MPVNMYANFRGTSVGLGTWLYLSPSRSLRPPPHPLSRINGRAALPRAVHLLDISLVTGQRIGKSLARPAFFHNDKKEPEVVSATVTSRRLLPSSPPLFVARRQLVALPTSPAARNSRRVPMEGEIRTIAPATRKEEQFAP